MDTQTNTLTSDNLDSQMSSMLKNTTVTINLQELVDLQKDRLKLQMIDRITSKNYKKS